MAAVGKRHLETSNGIQESLSGLKGAVVNSIHLQLEDGEATFLDIRKSIIGLLDLNEERALT